MEDKMLITVVIRWNNHQALLQVGNWARVFITKMLVYQVDCPLYSLPINSSMVELVERCDHRLKVRRS
jgi:hypothetical protein